MAEPYVYPTAEAVTEPSEAAQDPRKRAREIAEIAGAARFGWTSALDFGCGVGANFPVLAQAAQAGSWRLLGIEPDAARAAAARAAAAGLGAVEVLRGDWRAIGQARFDFILLCQVIGHTPRAECEAIVRALRASLTPGGRLAILHPVCTPAAPDAPGDYFHLVDLAVAHDAPAFRRSLDADAFDRAAAQPESGLLPVRCFRIEQIGWRRGDTLPAAAQPPESLAALLDGGALSARIYSAHTCDASGALAIGDMATVFQAEA